MDAYRPPCGGCDHHVFGCRNTCEPYAEWERMHAAMLAKKREYNRANDEAVQMTVSRKKRTDRLSHARATEKYRKRQG